MSNTQSGVSAGNAVMPSTSAHHGIGGKIRDVVRGHPAGGIAVVFILVQIACIIGGLLFPHNFRYLSEANIRVTLNAMPPLGIMALGVQILMIAGEFDLSVGTVYTFCAVLAATLVDNSFGGSASMLAPFLAMAVGVAVGVAAGIANGLVTIKFDIPSFITTLGTMLLWKGGVLLYNGASSVAFSPSEPFASLFGGSVWVFQAGFLWFIGLAVVCYFLLHHHKLGNHFFAVGGNRQAAVAIGINPTKVKLIAFAITGGLAALSGIITTTWVGSVQPGGGLGMELQAIAACVIGGSALMGGRGSILGVVLGTALVFTINDILLLLRAPGFYFDMFVGGLIVVAVITNNAIRRKS